MADPRNDRHELAERTTRLLSQLDGALDASMLEAIQGAWSMLERAATDSPAHARAVRSRLLWDSITPGTLLDPLPSLSVHDLVPAWDDEDAAVDGEDLADAA